MKRYIDIINTEFVTPAFAGFRTLDLRHPIQTTKKIYTHFMADSLYRNSIYLMLSTFIMAFFGFFFWVINARLYSPEQIGAATSIIAIAALVMGFSNLGFNNANIRFLANHKEKNKLLSIGFYLTSIITSILCVFSFLWIIHLKIVTQLGNSLLPIFFLYYSYLLLLNINSLLDSAFVAYRFTKYILIKNTITSFIKILLPIFLISLNLWGIIASIVISMFISIIFGFTKLINKFQFRPQLLIEKKILKQTGRFTMGNYVGNIFGILPSTLVPIIVASQLGTANAAFYYMPLMISSFLNIIPSATAQSLLAEASREEDRLNYYLWHSIKNIYFLLTPAVIIVMLLGNHILNLFGSNYGLEGSNILTIMALSSLVGAGNYIGDTLLNIAKNINMYIFMNIFNSLTIIILVNILIPRGLIWVAYAGLMGQAITLFVYIIINRKLILQKTNLR